MNRNFIKTGFAAGLGLLALGAAAPLALADPPGYYFQDANQQASPNTASVTARIAPDKQIEAVNQKADQALATAQRALREAQQTVQQRMQ